MKFKGELRTPVLQKYYITGSLEKKVDNSALQKMIRKIKDGGMNAFLNDSELKNFAKGMRTSFKAEGLINADDSLTSAGEEIVTSGKAWRGLQGAFFFTVLEYDGIPYLLDAELVDEQNIKNPKDGKLIVDFQNTERSVDFEDKEYNTADSTIRNIESDSNWAKSTFQPSQSSVKFSFDYETETCTVDVSWKDGEKNKKCAFVTTEESCFSILKRYEALELLKERENNEGVFEFLNQDRKSIRLAVTSEDQLLNKDWLESFFDAGSFTFKRIVFRDNKTTSCEISDVCLYIDDDETETTYALLNEYLLRKAETSYLGYSEVGHLVNKFQDLFTSPDENTQACPQIMKTTEKIYTGLVERAKQTYSENPIAYLHLQAFMDLSPENTIKPYIEKESTVNLTNQSISFYDLVEKVFGSERNVKEIFMLSKYTAANGRNARAINLFAQSVSSHFGVKPVIITTKEKEEVSPRNDRNFAESDRHWFCEMEKVVTVKEKPRTEIKSIHDRYYKVVRTDGKVEWYVLTGELDSLRFKNDYPRIREDVFAKEQGTVKEMTFAKIKQAGVPDVVVKLMEAK
ncbi:hypothetical protein J6Z39_01310 [bacterium]|nr:hypothetical protein [bacterium]